MASESSSAVLDLNDVDTEDTEPPSITEDTREAIPLIMETGYDIAVKVDAPMKQLSTLETFVTYRVRCVCARWPTPPYVRRRYNHFKLLHKRLSASQAWVAAPPLPPLHTPRQQLDRYSPSFVAVRTLALHAFLDRVAKHPIFTHSEDFRLFLTIPDDEFDKVFKSENSALNLWGLSSAIYGNADNKSNTNGPRVKDPEWSSYAEYLTSLQHKLTTLCSLTNKLHKGSAALSDEMMNMKRVCDAWSSQAGGATARALSALAAAGAGAPPSAVGAGAPPSALRRGASTHTAVLPLLALYTTAHVDKIRLRDRLHAAYVSGTNTSGEMHNKLEQCSEALRSELGDWLPKTRSEIKTLLLELADSQVALHSQIYYGWERALRLSNDANVDELFKTVSKTAVQNLSPSRCRSEMTPTETERDLDDLENYDSDSEVNERENGHEREEQEFIPASVSEIMNERDKSELENDGVSVSERKNESGSVSECVNERENIIERSNVSDVGNERSISEKEIEKSLSERENELASVSDRENEQSDWVKVNDSKETLNQKNDTKDQDKDFLSEILDDTTESGKDIKDSTSLEQSSKSDVVSDPLKEFSDVDLS